MTVIVIGVLLFPLIILLNVLLFHLLIRSAVKRIVKPALANEYLTYVDYKWVGFWGCGDFKHGTMDFALFKTGVNTLLIYSYIYYKDAEEIKRITIKINVAGLSVDNVEYSDQFRVNPKL